MSERSEVQNPMLRYAEAIGWQYVTPADALARRGGDRGLFLTDDLAAQLMRLNPSVLDSDRAAEVIRRLNLLRPTIEGNRDASYQRGECTESELVRRVEIESAGLLVYEDKDSISLALDRYDVDGTWRYIEHIPKVNVRRIRRLTV